MVVLGKIAPKAVPTQPSGPVDLDALRNLAAFKAFTPRGQRAFLAMLSGNNNRRSELAQKVVLSKRLLAPSTTPQALAAVFNDPQALPVLLKREPFAVTKKPAPFVLVALAERPGIRRYSCVVSGRTITFNIPTSLDTTAVCARLADALASVPIEVVDQLSQVDVKDKPSPDDAYWSGQYGTQVLAAMSCGSEGSLNVFPEALKQDRDTLVRNIFHEAGHAFTLRLFGEDEDDAGWDAWRHAQAEDVMSPSYYATCSVYEDSAETFLLYLITRGTPAFEEYRKMMPNRFELLRKALAGVAD